MKTPVVPPALRSWLYGIAVAGGAVATTYGWLTEAQVTAWLGLTNAILVAAAATAFAYRPTREEDER